MLGNLLLIAYFKTAKQQRYCLASIYPKRPEEIFKLSEKMGVPEIAGFIPTESQIAQTLAVALSTYITWLMVKTIRDQNNY